MQKLGRDFNLKRCISSFVHPSEGLKEAPKILSLWHSAIMLRQKLSLGYLTDFRDGEQRVKTGLTGGGVSVLARLARLTAS